MKSLSISIQFKSECYKRYLAANPDQAQAFAVAYFEQFTVLSHKYQKLEAQNKQLKSSLAQAHRDHPPSLPGFIEATIKQNEILGDDVTNRD